MNFDRKHKEFKNKVRNIRFRTVVDTSKLELLF
jgi:hypothetical protein